MDQIRWVDYARVREEIDDLQAQLDAVTKEEPVAWIDDSGHPKHIRHWQSVTERRLYGPLRPLYAAPPQRKPLTEEEIDGLMQSIGLRCADDGNERMSNHAEWERRERRRIARAIERAHGITP